MEPKEFKTVKDAILHTSFTIILFSSVIALLFAACTIFWTILTTLAP